MNESQSDQPVSENQPKSEAPIAGGLSPQIEEEKEPEVYSIAPINASMVNAMHLNDDDMSTVRENQRRLDERERERRLQLRQEVLSDGERDDAIIAACRAILLGALPVVSIFFTVAASRGVFVHALGAVICLGIPAVLLLIGAGIGSAILAHSWFKHSDYPVTRIAVALALMIDFGLLGFAVLLPRWL